MPTHLWAVRCVSLRFGVDSVGREQRGCHSHMSRTPVEELESGTGIEKFEDETVREYVDRVGSEHDVDADTRERAHAYITEWYYADAPPEDDEAFRTLLRQARDAGESDDAGEQVTDPPEISPESEATVQAEPAPSTEPASAGEDVQEAGSGTEPSPEPPAHRESVSTQPRFKSGLEGGDSTRLLLRFAAIVVTAPVIGLLMARVWVPGNPLYDQIWRLMRQALGIPGAAAVDLLAVFGLGLYAGLLVLFIADIKKRVQGMLLVLGTVLAFGIVAYTGVFFPSLEFTPLNAVGLGLGFVAGLAMEAGQLLSLDVRESTFQRPTLDSGAVPEFRYAALTLFGLVALVVVVTLVQSVVTGESFVLGVPAVAVFLVLLYQFVQYESETSYMTLGPERSGKSMLLLGLCLELLRHSETHPDPNAYLREGLERASNLQHGHERWPIPSTAHDEVRTASFEVIAGYYFPRRLEVSALDYAGQHLGRIADVLASDGEPDPEASVPEDVATRVTEADTLFFVLDVERLVFPEEFHEAGATDRANVSWGLDHYTTILTHIDPDDVLVVATKCDILVDQDIVAPPEAHESFDDFGDAVTDHLSSRPDVRELFQRTDASEVHPVYYATEKRDGEYVPQLDEDANLVPVGYGNLIDEVRSRQ